MRRRQRVWLLVAVTCALVSTGGLVTSTLVKSPEQARAEAEPPAASVLTAVVEHRVLASTMVTRGSVAAMTTLEVTPVTADAGAQVVTAVGVKAGDAVRPGQVLIAVSGRPLIVLAGVLPAYRDLKPGDSGSDVRQLQNALKTLRHYRGGDKAGYFGSSTKTAVRRLYAKIGYDVPDTGGPAGTGDKASLQATRDSVDAAQRELDAVKRRIAAGEEPGPVDEPWSVQLARATQQLDRAKRAQSDLIAHTGPKMPLAEFVFVSSFPAQVTALAANVGDPVQAPLITLAVGDLAVLVRARPDQAAMLRPGMDVQLVAETLGQEVHGSVAKIGELTPPAEGEGAPYRPMTVATSQPLDSAWAGLDVRVTITSTQTKTEVLVVPLSAISAGADGRSTVSVVDAAGRVSRVEVRPGASGDGFVEVSPVTGQLAEGDHVIVGAAS